LTNKLILVDAAGFRGRYPSLPGEVSTTTSWLGREVSRSHSSQRDLSRYPSG